MTKPSDAIWKEMPDAEGWYFIGRRSERTDRWKGEWVYIYMVGEHDGDPTTPHVFNEACETFIAIPKKLYPIKRWYGPVAIGDES